MAEKKEKAPIVHFEELLVKLQNIYSDMYIYKQKFCIPAVNSQENQLGPTICTLEQKYTDVLKALEVPDIFYMNNVKEIRTQIKEGKFELSYLRESHLVESADIETVLVEMLGEIDSEIQDTSNIWVSIGSNEELMKCIYTDKMIYQFPMLHDGVELGSVTIAKQMLPLVTEKTAEKAFLCIKESKEFPELYQILFDYQFTHFKIQAMYHSLPIVMN
jgi:hypothetical protein